MNNLNLPLKEKVKYLLIVLAMLGLVVLYVFEFSFFHLTFNLAGLVTKGVVAGLIFGVLLGRYYQKQASDLTETVQLYVFFVVLNIVFMPLVLSLSNRLLSFGEPEFLEVEYVNTEAFFSDRYGLIKGEEVKPTGYYLFFYYHNRLKRIRLDQPAFQDSTRGSTILLPVKKGVWGHAVVIPDRIGERGI